MLSHHNIPLTFFNVVGIHPRCVSGKNKQTVATFLALFIGDHSEFFKVA